MNKDLNAKQIVIIVIPFAILLAAYIWAQDQLMDRVFPRSLKTTPWNTLTLPTSDGQIYEFKSNGELIRRINSKEFGIELAPGDIQFLDQDTLLIYSRNTLNSTSDNLKIMAKQSPEVSYSQSEGLMKCSIFARSCSRFTDQLPLMKGVFHTALDTTNQTLYYSDTNQHKLYRFNLDGQKENDSGDFDLHFPNQIKVIEDRAIVVDTNNKALKAFPLDKPFSEGKTLFEIEEDAGCSQRSNPVDIFLPDPKCWPTSFVKVDREYWVTVATNALDDASIHKYSWFGEFLGEVNLKEKLTHLDLLDISDPTSLVQVEGEVLYLDANNVRIIKINPSTDQYSSLKVQGLAAVLAKSREHKRKYDEISHWIIYAFVLLFVIGFSYALRDHLNNDRLAKNNAALDKGLPTPPNDPF